MSFLHICFHNFRYTRERKFYSDRGLPCPKDQALEEENDKKEEEHEPNTPGENIRLFDTTCFLVDVSVVLCIWIFRSFGYFMTFACFPSFDCFRFLSHFQNFQNEIDRAPSSNYVRTWGWFRK